MHGAGGAVHGKRRAFPERRSGAGDGGTGHPRLPLDHPGPCLPDGVHRPAGQEHRAGVRRHHGAHQGREGGRDQGRTEGRRARTECERAALGDPRDRRGVYHHRHPQRQHGGGRQQGDQNLYGVCWPWIM